MTAKSKYSTLRQWWTALDSDRSMMLNRKREHSMFTIPSLLPWSGRVSSTALEVPYSSTFADGINALSSRLMGVVMPLNGQPIFEISNVTPFDPEGKDDSDLSAVFSRFGRYAMKSIAPTNLRSQLVLLYSHLIAIGDCLMELDESFNARLFRADQYVVRRKHEGDWVDIIIQELILPEFHSELSNLMSHAKISVSDSGGEEEWEELYTHIHKDPDTGEITKVQEFRDHQVGEEEKSPISRWMPVRWKSIIGEAYGTSLVEDNFGDALMLDAMAKGLQDGVLLNAEYRWGVNPAGLTEVADLLASVNGDYVAASPNDVFPLQFQNAAQVNFTDAAYARQQQIVNNKFLQGGTRDAERVTAREIVKDAQQLEERLGGILSMAGREVQDPIVRWVLHVMGEKKLIPDVISEEITKQDGLVKLSIKAGLEILQREAEREKLDGAIERMRNLPEAAQRAFIWTGIAKDWWESMGLESVGRVKTQEQLQQEDQQAIQQQAAMSAVQQAAQQQPQQESS